MNAPGCQARYCTICGEVLALDQPFTDTGMSMYGVVHSGCLERENSEKGTGGTVMTPAVRDELAWAIRHAEHEFLVRLVDDPADRAKAMFWFGSAQGIRLAISIVLGEAALSEVLKLAVPEFVIDDGMAATA